GVASCFGGKRVSGNNEQSQVDRGRMMRKWIANNKAIMMILALTIISAIAYLPLMGQIGYVNDDWYLMYSAGAYGTEAFIDIFSVDRPARALVMIPAYTVFGENPLYYNLSAYVFRLISAFAFYWLLRMLFPGEKKISFIGSLLFLIYPGFLSQINGVDYQSHILALAVAHLSIALTIKAILTDRFRYRFLFYSISILLGLLYLSQMEWYIGFELFRWGGVFLLSSRKEGSFLHKVWIALCWGFPLLVVPIIFLVWRIFFFQSERGATSVDIQFEQVKLYPIQTLYHWAIQVLQDLYDVSISVWMTPLSQLRGHIQWWGVALATLGLGVFLYMMFFDRDQDKPVSLSGGFLRDAFVLGVFIAIGGLIPIAMVNRDVSYPTFSRYSLVGSAGVALFFCVVLLSLKQRIFRDGLIGLLIVVSVLTHHANAVKAARATAFTNSFWWQVSWRVPQLAKNATLIVNYPGAILEEDYFIWGPANLIYYPDKQNIENIQPGVYAVLLNDDTIEKVHARERQVYDKRKTITTYSNYRNILVMTQPSVNSCVHVIDGTSPEYSVGESDFVREVGAYSEIEHVLMDEMHHTPPTVIFGPEPDHGWCYFYQKADLARQRGEWEKVLEIGEQAFGRGFEPKDSIELMPFLQVYALKGDVKHLEELSSRVRANAFIAHQACETIGNMPEISPDVADAINSFFCPE
ncbi:MAG TPA: hypothetical protein VLA72_14275, partial [Anaerolineales bacterium]|nr:hypothetical protein [Anaerolineales bacterium]